MAFLFSSLRLLVFIILLSSCSIAQKVDYVYDSSNVLSQREQNELNKSLRKYEKESSNGIVVYIENDSNNVDLENYATYLFNNLGPGKKGINNGLLLYLNMNQKRVILRIGYGIEWSIFQPGLDSIVNSLIPHFKDEDYFLGLTSAINNIQSKLSNVTWTICDAKLNNIDCIEEIQILRVIKDNKSSIEVETVDKQNLFIRYTNFMRSLIDRIKNADNPAIYCRRTTDKQTKLLLGIIEKNSTIHDN